MKHPFLSCAVPCLLLAVLPVKAADELLVAVSPAIAVDAACAASRDADEDSLAAALTSGLSAGITRALRAEGVAAVADPQLGKLLLALDRLSPDPADYRRTREHVTAAGAARLTYVNDLRIAAENPEAGSRCVLRFNAALWNADPFSRRAVYRDSAEAGSDSGISDAARRVADWVLRER